jgi:UDP-GlcNAc:undecaprenyl-phosphate GlcNAc-1-phosphate transferase
MELLPRLTLVVLATVVLTQLILPVARRAGLSWGLVDHPSWRRRQKCAVPCSGGLAVYATGVVAAIGLFHWIGAPFPLPAMVALGLAGLGTIVLGALDDRFGLHAEKKLLGQVLVVSLPMAGGLTLQHVWLPGVGVVELGVMAGPLTLFWYLGFINSVNLIDGLDGLASGIVAIVAGTIMVAVHGVDPVGALWIGAFLGAVLGFLRDNLSRHRIFLGDAGSMLLGLWLAGLVLGLADRTPTVPGIAAFAMLVPVLDTATTIVRRWRRGLSIFRPDAEHLHHRLLELGTSPLRATVCLWFVSMSAAATGALVLGAPSAGVLAVAAAAGAAIELAYSIQRDRHPGPGRILGYLLGVHATLVPVDPGQRLAEVIEMEAYRRQRSEPGSAPVPRPATRAGGADADEAETTETPAAPAAADDVVLALPDEPSR